MYKAKRVCVIGAGPSGMSALYQFKQLEMKGQEIPEIVCFEKQSDWGGLWNYSWRTGRRLFCWTCINVRGGSRIFLGGGALVSCCTPTPINHIVFFFRIPVVLENRRSSQRGGCAPPAPSP